MVCCCQAVTIEAVLAESEHAARVHPAVLRLGLAYADGSVTGGNARCVALLSTLRAVLQARPTCAQCALLVISRQWSGCNVVRRSCWFPNVKLAKGPLK